MQTLKKVRNSPTYLPAHSLSLALHFQPPTHPPAHTTDLPEALVSYIVQVNPGGSFSSSSSSSSPLLSSYRALYADLLLSQVLDVKVRPTHPPTHPPTCLLSHPPTHPPTHPLNSFKPPSSLFFLHPPNPPTHPLTHPTRKRLTSLDSRPTTTRRQRKEEGGWVGGWVGKHLFLHPLNARSNNGCMIGRREGGRRRKKKRRRR